MALFVWKPEFDTNIEEIDQQHKKLVETINILHEAMNKGKGKDVLSKVFANLLEYTTEHFATEEKLMIAFVYPDYVEHKQEHEKCVAEVLKFKERFDQGDLSVTINLRIFLVDWLHAHLMEMDMKYVPFFQEKGL